jgi:hypothetical protein
MVETAALQFGEKQSVTYDPSQELWVPDYDGALYEAVQGDRKDGMLLPFPPPPYPPSSIRRKAWIYESLSFPRLTLLYGERGFTVAFVIDQPVFYYDKDSSPPLQRYNYGTWVRWVGALNKSARETQKYVDSTTHKKRFEDFRG